MVKVSQLTELQKIKLVEHQMDDARDGKTDQIHCPWCATINVEGTPLCCVTFGEVVSAILEKWFFDRQNEIVAKVAMSGPRSTLIH